MKLIALLKAHDRALSDPTIQNALPGILGDAYLLKFNPTYRNIRLSAKDQKFKFSNQRFHDYDALSLTQLPRILSSRTIPYVDTVSALRDIEKQVPNTFSLANIPPLTTNHVFHESAHAAVHAVIEEQLRGTAKPGIARERELALKILLEEAFANACESFANIFAEDELHDEFLFKNTYIMEEKRVRELLRKAGDQFGPRPVFRILLFSFLHANFQRTHDGMQNLARVIRLALAENPEGLKKLRNRDLALLRSIFKTGLDLDPEFTVFTNQFCLRLAGIKTPLAKLFAYDFLEGFESKPAYQKCIDSMISIAVGN